MSDTYSIGVMPARGAARGARSARRKRPIDFQRTLEMMSALGEFKPISTEEARQGLEMAQALDGYPIDDRPVGQRDPIQLGAPRERFDPMALDETAMQEIPGTPRLDVNDPQARRDAALAAMGPISVESGSWGEALAEGLTQYLRGQAGAREFDRAQDERSEEKFQERGRRNAMTAAVGLTNASPSMMASALAPYAPEEALELNMGESARKREQEQKREDAIWTLDQELDPGRAERRRGIAAADEEALLRVREPFQVRADARQQTRGSGGVTYRPVTPEEAEVFGLPGGGLGYLMGSNGRPVPVGGRGTFPAEQRARVAITFEPALEASQALEAMDAQAKRRQGTRGGNTPLGQDWGARIAEAVPFDDGAAARAVGGQDYDQYVSAASTFESSMLPILSGAAVTDSEARRMIRAALPQLGNSQAVLQDKARRRRQMLNGAALIGGNDPPFPDAGVPAWAAGAVGQGNDRVGLEGLTEEQLMQLREELLNGGR